jgi:hypothetical protein
MAQGIARNKEEVLEVLRPYFQLGCSVNKACKYAGIPESTVDTWLAADDDLRAKVVAWQNEINAKARANWRAKIASGDFEPSKQWLERTEKDDFSIKTETDITTGGEKINGDIVEKVTSALDEYFAQRNTQ